MAAGFRANRKKKDVYHPGAKFQHFLTTMSLPRSLSLSQLASIIFCLPFMVLSVVLKFRQSVAIFFTVEAIMTRPYLRGHILSDRIGSGKTWEAVEAQLKVSPSFSMDIFLLIWADIS